MHIARKQFDQNSLVLGTALWGWKINKSEAFALLDNYVELGGRLIDTAANYPINKIAQDMGLAVKWVGEWLSANPSADIDIWYKVGAINNLGGDDANLSYNNLIKAFNEAQQLLHQKIRIIGVHWDNRTKDDFVEIKDTLRFFKEQSKLGYQVALSGVKHPDLYHTGWPENTENWLVQVKDNALTSCARKHYSVWFPQAKYYAYGINMGGVKNTAPPAIGSSLALRGISPVSIAKKIESFIEAEHKISPSVKSFNDFALMRTFLDPHLFGVILGCSSVAQLQQSFNFWRVLHEGISCNARPSFSEFL